MVKGRGSYGVSFGRAEHGSILMAQSPPKGPHTQSTLSGAPHIPMDISLQEMEDPIGGLCYKSPNHRWDSDNSNDRAMLSTSWATGPRLSASEARSTCVTDTAEDTSSSPFQEHPEDDLETHTRTHTHADTPVQWPRACSVPVNVTGSAGLLPVCHP